MLNIFKLFTIIILLLSVLSVKISFARGRFTFCPNDELYRIGTKTICEYLFIRKPVSCLSPIQVNTKAFVNCRYGYANKENITEQKIICTYAGTWSEPPIECEDVCEPDSTPTKLVLGLKETWYIEMKGIRTSCPSVILNSKLLLTKANCVLEYKSYDLQVETDESTDPQTLVVKTMHYDNRYSLGPNGLYNDDILAIMELDNNIIYNKNVRSACIDFNNPIFSKQERFIKENLEKFKPSRTYDYSYIKSSCAPEHFMNTIQSQTAVQYKCFLGSREIPCDKPLEQGSTVQIRCKLGYQKTNLNSPDEIKCISDGKWDGEVDHKCSLICGQLDIEKPSIIPLVSRGEPIDIINVPWHVGIYSNSTKSRRFEQICGGTLVHFNIVISAAHCFFIAAINSLDNEGNYFVASGKKYRNFEATEINAQFSGIKKIYIPSTYNVNFYRHDLAVLVLEDNLKFNTYTRPACLDWFPYGQYDIEGGKNGRVVGWGKTSQNGDFSSTLLAIELKTLSNKECKNLVHPNDKEEITGEKFCAVGKEGQSACQGDSGGGFLIKKRYNYDEDRYHLWGVVSSGVNPLQHCTANFLTTYTNVQYHQDIIKTIIAQNLKDK